MYLRGRKVLFEIFFISNVKYYFWMFVFTGIICISFKNIVFRLNFLIFMFM